MEKERNEKGRNGKGKRGSRISFGADPKFSLSEKNPKMSANSKSSHGANCFHLGAMNTLYNRLFAPKWKLRIFSQCEDRFQIG